MLRLGLEMLGDSVEGWETDDFLNERGGLVLLWGAGIYLIGGWFSCVYDNVKVILRTRL